MRAIVLAALLAASFVLPAKAELTSREAAELLDGAVVRYTPRRGDGFCTAFAIGPTTFMSAGHCALTKKSYLESPLYWTTASSVEIGVGDKTTRTGSAKDWSIITSYEELGDVVPLELACGEELYVGLPIAYMGFPSPLERFYGQGFLGSLEESQSNRNNSDGIVDLAAAPGASGSPVISMETGHVVGILTEGYFSNVGVVAVGIELIDPEHCPGEPEIETAPPSPF